MPDWRPKYQRYTGTWFGTWRKEWLARVVWGPGCTQGRSHRTRTDIAQKINFDTGTSELPPLCCIFFLSRSSPAPLHSSRAVSASPRQKQQALAALIWAFEAGDRSAFVTMQAPVLVLSALPLNLLNVILSYLFFLSFLFLLFFISFLQETYVQERRVLFTL